MSPSSPLSSSALLLVCGSQPGKSQAEQREQLVPGPKGHIVCQAHGELGVGSQSRGLEHVPPAPEHWGYGSRVMSNRVRASCPGKAFWWQQAPPTVIVLKDQVG